MAEDRSPFRRSSASVARPRTADRANRRLRSLQNDRHTHARRKHHLGRPAALARCVVRFGELRADLDFDRKRGCKCFARSHSEPPLAFGRSTRYFQLRRNDCPHSNVLDLRDSCPPPGGVSLPDRYSFFHPRKNCCCELHRSCRRHPVCTSAVRRSRKETPPGGSHKSRR